MTMVDNTAMAVARAAILFPAALDEAVIVRALATLAPAGADLADLYFEAVTSRRWRLEDGRVVGGGFGTQQGVGIRAARHGEVAFAHSADLRAPALDDTARAVRAMIRHGDGVRRSGGIALSPPAGPGHRLYPAIDAVSQPDAESWTALLERVDQWARDADPRIDRVDATLTAVDQVVLIADLDGRLSADVRPLVRLGVTVVARAGGKQARGGANLGGRHGLAGLDDAAIHETVRRAVTIATVNLDARPAPTGTMPVVLAPGYPGVLFHEAVGHGLEGDHHRKAVSVFNGRMGERIAAPGVTVIDDGGLPGRTGSIGIDDEGTPADRTVLIDDGVLVGLMQDRLNAGLMNARPTGNGRRQSYAHLPMPRMTNTFLAAGTHDPADIVASVDNGIYAVGFGGGQVDITTGRFNFSTTLAYRIEGGRITAPIAGATLIGAGDEALRHIGMIGTDLALDSGEASCGKQGQWLDVGVGQPTLRIDGMMVGGRG